MRRHQIIRYILLITITIIGIWYTPDRNIQHLLCAIVMPQLLIEIGRLSKYIGVFRIYSHGYIYYLSWCLFWEFMQFFFRESLQIYQLMFDGIGIILSYLIFEVIGKKNRKK